MKTKELVMIATAAFGTATLTVVMFWTSPIDAGNDADTPPPKIAKSLLVSHGIELALAPSGGRAFKAGDQPEFELTAVNTTQQPASASVWVTMTSSSPADMISRVGPRPKVLWQRQQIVTLPPNETKALTLGASTNLPANSVISISLGEQDPKTAPFAPGIEALGFSTVVPKALPTIASAR